MIRTLILILIALLSPITAQAECVAKEDVRYQMTHTEAGEPDGYDLVAEGDGVLAGEFMEMWERIIGRRDPLGPLNYSGGIIFIRSPNGQITYFFTFAANDCLAYQDRMATPLAYTLWAVAKQRAGEPL